MKAMSRSVSDNVVQFVSSHSVVSHPLSHFHSPCLTLPVCCQSDLGISKYN